MPITKPVDQPLEGQTPNEPHTENHPPAITPGQLMEQQEPVSVTPPDNANVRLAPSNKGKALPKGLCNIGQITVEIPDELSQEVGFHVEHPAILVGQFPQYKFFHKKGDDVPTIKF